MTRGVSSVAGSRSVAKLRSGAPVAFRKERSTTIVGVRPMKMTLPPAAAKARRRSRTFFSITVEVGTITAR